MHSRGTNSRSGFLQGWALALLLAVGLAGFLYTIRDAFQPLPAPVPAEVVFPAPAAASAPDPVAATKAAAPVLARTPDVEEDDSALGFGEPDPATADVLPPQASTADLAALEKDVKRQETFEMYRKRFRAPDTGDPVHLRFLNGRQVSGRFQRFVDDRVEVMLDNAAIVGFTREQLASESRARFFAEDYAEAMTERAMRLAN